MTPYLAWRGRLSDADPLVMRRTPALDATPELVCGGWIGHIPESPLYSGVTGQSIPPAGLYPGLKRPRLDYTRVYYGLGQLIPRSILWPRPIHTPSGQIIHP